MSLNISRSKSMAFLAAVMMVTSGAALGVGAFSYFSDTGSVPDNVFTAGRINMKLSEDKSSWSEDLSGAWGANKFAPGDITQNKIWIKNDGTLDGNVLLLDFEKSDNYNATFAQNIKVWISFGNETDGTNDPAGFDYTSFGNLSTYIHEEDSGPGSWDYVIFENYTDKGEEGITDGDLYTDYLLPADTKHFLGLKFKFKEDAPNSLQGKTTGFNLELKTFHIDSPVTRGLCESVPM